MAVNTTVTNEKFHTGKYSWMNVQMASPTGISVGMPLTIGNGLVVTVQQVRPANRFKVRVTTVPKVGMLKVKNGHAVTG